MSDFKIKVTADLDTSQVEAKLMALQNRKITIQANAILWILELVSYLSVLSWGISFQFVEKPAESVFLYKSDSSLSLQMLI